MRDHVLSGNPILLNIMVPWTGHMVLGKSLNGISKESLCYVGIH